jgi:hypothetical protein
VWILAVLAVVFFVLLALGRTERKRRVAAAATVELVVDDWGVKRTLADGRYEEVSWAELQRVEAVTLPRGVRGEPLRFILDGGGLRGCIVPRQVAEAAADSGSGSLMAGLARLPRFDLAGLAAALEGDRPGTTRVLWERPAGSSGAST